MEQKNIIIAIAVILLVVTGAVLFSHKNLNGNVVAVSGSEANYSNGEWLSDNCDCLEHNRKGCANSSFTYANGLCRDANLVTNPINKCSLYNCSGEKVEFKG
ncbi:hypothetical protein HY212_04110 [Candidatus Pacearchaeota archaeon]|nr:hypothetical protein [Candidatus Pacearchaeota archaeon]